MAFRWENGATQWLGTFGGDSSMAYDVSADGSTVVGYAKNSSGMQRAFRWRNGAMRDLGVLPQYEGVPYIAYGVSGDGNIVVGSFGGYGGERAFRWTPEGGMEDLNQTYAEFLQGGARLAVARAISADGKFIVGYGYRSMYSYTPEAFVLDTRRLPRPVIESIQLQQDCQGPYIEGIPASNALQVRIANWNGGRGRVQVRLPRGVNRVVQANSDLVTIPINMGEDLIYTRNGGWCEVEVTAYNAEGSASETRMVHFYAIGLPPSLQPAAWLVNPEGSFCNTSGRTVARFFIKIPPFLLNASARVPARLPFMSDTNWGQNTEWFTAQVDLEANSMLYPQNQLQGIARLKIGRDIDRSYQAQVRLPRNRVAIVDWGWEVGGGAEGVFQLSPRFQLQELNITTQAGVNLETPNLLPVLIATCCTPLTPLSRVAELYGRFNLGAEGSIKLYDAENGLGFQGSELGLSLQGELVLSTSRSWREWAFAECSAGVRPFITLQFPGNQQNANFFRGVPYIRQVGIEGFMRAKVFILFAEDEYDILSGRYVYPADAMGMLGVPVWMQGGKSSGWRAMERPYLKQGDYHQVLAGSQFFPQDGGSDYTEETLVQNLFPIADPAVALYNGYPAIAYVYDDPNLPAHQFAEIRVLMQRPDDTWQDTPVTQDTALDSQPQIAVDSVGNLVAVWTRMENVAPDPDPQLRLPKGEIAYSVYNATTNTWSPPVLLTQDSALDTLPRLVRGADGNLYLVWLKSPNNQFPVDFTQNPSVETDLWVARWNGAAFVDAHRAIPDANAVECALAVTSNGTPVLVWSRFSDKRLFYSFYQNGAWTTPAQVWNNPQPQSSPVLTVSASDRPVLYFVRTGIHPQSEEYDIHELMVTDFGSTEWNAPLSILQSEALNDLQVLSSPSGKAAVLWQRSSEGGVDVWAALYEPTVGQWSAPMRLTHNERAFEQQISAILDASENPLAVYVKRQQTRREVTVEDDAGNPHTVEVTELGRADLTLLRFTPRADLKLESLATNPPNATAGQAAQLIARVSNLRTKGVVNPQVRFYDGDPNAGGSVIGTAIVNPNPLAGGGSGIATLNWTIPNDGRPRTLYAVVDPDNAVPETDETNNRASLPLAALDFVAGPPTLAQYLPSGEVEIRFTIENPSTVSPTGNLAWQLRRDSPTGALIAQGTIPAPTAQQQTTLTHIWNPGLSAGRYTLFLVIDPANQFAESDETNNARGGEIPLLPDLLLNPQFTDITRNGVQVELNTLVHNRGWQDAPAFTVQVLDGPPGVGATLATRSIDPLQRGGSRALNFQFTLPRRLARVWLAIDPNNAVQDAERRNNTLILSLSWREGDANGDGCVDDADLLEVLFNFGQQGENLSADLNNDGIIDDADLLLTLFNFGAGC